MHGTGFERKQQVYEEVIAYSKDSLMRALARIAQAKLSGQGCVLTRDEAVAMYASVQDQIETALSGEREKIGKMPQRRRAH